MTGAHLVGDRADSADARGDVGRLVVSRPREKSFEEPRRLEDLAASRPSLAALDLHKQAALAFDSGQIIDFDRT